MLTVTAIPAFTDNYIWLIESTEHNHCVVVDPGDAEPVIDYLKTHDKTLCAILITHHHHDHTGGIAELIADNPVPVYGPANSKISAINHPVKENHQVNIAELGLNLTVIETPGHTLDHISYFGHDWLFCGDTLFAGGCGRVFEGSFEQMYQSINKLKILHKNTLIYCAHEYTEDNLRFALTLEPNNKQLKKRYQQVIAQRKHNKITLPSTLSDELATNPFLRCDQASIQTTAKNQDRQPSEVFAAIRQLKDDFK